MKLSTWWTQRQLERRIARYRLELTHLDGAERELKATRQAVERDLRQAEGERWALSTGNPARTLFATDLARSRGDRTAHRFVTVREEGGQLYVEKVEEM